MSPLILAFIAIVGLASAECVEVFPVAGTKCEALMAKPKSGRYTCTIVGNKAKVRAVSSSSSKIS